MASTPTNAECAARSARPHSLDATVLGENTMHDVALQKELFDLYFGQASVYVAQLSEAVTCSDRRGWSNAAHSLKGTARTLGLMWLAAATATAEHGAPSHRQLSEIEDALFDARAASAAYLASSHRAA